MTNNSLFCIIFYKVLEDGFMYLVNLMEQKVSKLADSYLKDKNIPVNTNMRMDIIAYTLNRVQPQYVTSARGVLHSYNKDPIQSNTEILSIIADACETVRKCYTC